ncbi:MAG: acyl-CoA dehydrogenase family protein [Actinomycetota bacterium]|nr:acyl-CoA dehydrogenase family protein [Actinomycetota bacterium]
MERNIFGDEHRAFRDMVRDFIAHEVTPYHEQWERDGIVSRDLWLAGGKAGLLGIDVPEEYGGGATADFRFNAIVAEELAWAGASGVGYPLHNDIVAPYLLQLCTPEQRQRWLPGFCRGELITAIAMTEPGAGSDLQGIRSTAVRDGEDWVLSGAKTFISNGLLADLVVVVARTDPDAGARGFSLLAVERDMPGFERGRNLDKIGMHAQDTAELWFTDVRVPAENVLGEPGQGFVYLMQNLPQERMSLAVSATAGAEAAISTTLQYCQDRHAFGKPIGAFQNTRFTLAEMATEAALTREFVDRCIIELGAGTLSNQDAAMAKWWSTEMLKRTVDRCLQLHGGYGYLTEYPIAKAYLDARVQTIYGGTTEIMKEIIGQALLG